jgi:hypothetical protein
MCDVNGPFKLCTCSSDIDRTKPHWILHRYIQSREECQLLGLFGCPNPYQMITSINLKRRMNSVNVFDFDYHPQEGDMLRLFLKTAKGEETDDLDPDFELEFINNKWRILDNFISVDYKHSAYHVGEIQGPKSELTSAYEYFEKNADEKEIHNFNYFSMFPPIPINLKKQKKLIEYFRNEVK